MEPNIPEQTMHNQLQKLPILPLRKFAQDLTSTPVIIVLDSIHHCEDVKHIIIPIVQVINELQTDEHQVNMTFVITSVSYDYILDMLRRRVSFPVCYHLILPNYYFIRRTSFVARNLKYKLPYTVQLFVDMLLVVILVISLCASIMPCMRTEYKDEGREGTSAGNQEFRIGDGQPRHPRDPARAR